MLNTTTMPDYFKYFYIAWAIKGIFQLVKHILRENNICSKKTDGHLIWDFDPKNSTDEIIWLIMYLILTTMPFLYLKDTNVKYIISSIWLGSWLLHYIVYPNHWKSMWCFFVSGMITIYSLVRYMQIKN